MATPEGTPDSRWFEWLVDKSGGVVFLLRVRPDLAVEYIGGDVESLVGRTVAQCFADPQIILGATDAGPAERVADILALEPGAEASFTAIWHHQDGRETHASTVVRSRQREDGSVVLDGIARNVTQLRQLEKQLHRSEVRYRLLVENAWDAVWTTSYDGTLTHISPAIQRLRGLSVGAMMNLSLDQPYAPESAESIRKYYLSAFLAAKTGTMPPPFRLEHEFRHEDGSRVATELQFVPHIDEDGHIVEIIGVARDITQRKQFEAELKRLAVTDPVTGVWNRRHGEELVCADLVAAQHDCRPLSLLMLDIDEFKVINDTRGHQAGDRVLVEMSQRLVSVCRDADVVARWGGEEFLILLRDCPLREGIRFGEEVRAAIANVPFVDTGRVTLSVGVAEARADDDVTSWVARADEALYEAKRSGRNAVRASC